MPLHLRNRRHLRIDQLPVSGSDAVRALLTPGFHAPDPVLSFDFDQDGGAVLTNRASTGPRFNGSIQGTNTPSFATVRTEERPKPPIIRSGSFEAATLAPWSSGPTGQPITGRAAHGSRGFHPGSATTDVILRQRLQIPSSSEEWRFRFAFGMQNPDGPAGEINVSLGGQLLSPVRLPGGILNPVLRGNAGWNYAGWNVRLPEGTAELEITIPPALASRLILDDFDLRPVSEAIVTKVGFAQESVSLQESYELGYVELVREGDLSRSTYVTVELRTGTATVNGPAADVSLRPSWGVTNRIPTWFGPGAAICQVWLDVPRDRTTEPVEWATLALVSAEDAVIGRSEVNLQLLDEPASVLLRVPETVREGQEAALTLQLDFGSPIEVRLKTASEGSATPGSDFTPLDQILLLTTNVLTLPLSILQDTDPEKPESLRIEITPTDPGLAIEQSESGEPVQATLIIEDDERSQLVQRILIPTGGGAGEAAWTWHEPIWPLQAASQDRDNTEAPEIIRVLIGDGSILFLDAEGQPMEPLGNGTGRLVPGAGGTPKKILRVLPDGSFLGQSSLPGGRCRIERILPNGSPDPAYIHILDVSDGAHVSRSGTAWVPVVLQDTGDGTWRFHDATGRTPEEAARPPLAYRIVGTDAQGRVYFAFQFWKGATADQMPLGLLFRCLPNGVTDERYSPLPTPIPHATSYSFGPLSPSGTVLVSVQTTDTETGDTALTVLEVSADGRSVSTVATPSQMGFRRIALRPSGEPTVIRQMCISFRWWGSCGTWYDSLLDGITLRSTPALLPPSASEHSGPAWATAMPSTHELPGNPDAWPPAPALPTLTPPWYRELRTSPVPEAGFSDTGLFLPESGLSVTVLRAGSTATMATVRGRVFARTTDGWDPAGALPFEATFPAGASETVVDVSFLALEGTQPLREFLLRLESGSGVEISPFRACRIRVIDDLHLPATGELRLVTGTGRDESGTAYLIGQSTAGTNLRSAPTPASTNWTSIEGTGARILDELISTTPTPRTWVLPVPAADQELFFRLR